MPDRSIQKIMCMSGISLRGCPARPSVGGAARGLLAVLVALAWSLPGMAQQPSARVALVHTPDPAPVAAAARAVVDAMAESAVAMDRIEIRPQRPVPIPDGEGPIIAVGAIALHYVARHAGTRPVFYCLVAQHQVPRHAMALDLHGVAVESTLIDQLSVIKAAQPGLTRLGVLESEPEMFVRELQRDAEQLGLDVVMGEDGAALIRADVDLVWLGHASTVNDPPTTRMLLLQGIRARVPVVAPVPSLVIAGAPLGIGMSPEGHGRQVATLVVDHLAGVAAPRFSRPELELHVNDRTMRACGIRLRGAPAQVVHHGSPAR